MRPVSSMATTPGDAESNQARNRLSLALEIRRSVSAACWRSAARLACASAPEARTWARCIESARISSIGAAGRSDMLSLGQVFRSRIGDRQMYFDASPPPDFTVDNDLAAERSHDTVHGS